MIINKKSILTQLLDIDFYWFPINCYWLLLIVIDYWLSLIDIAWYYQMIIFYYITLRITNSCFGDIFFSRSPFFRSQLPRAWDRLPAMGMAQTGLCKFAMNIVDFFLSQINRRMFFEENATAVGNFSTLSAEFDANTYLVRVWVLQ